VPKYTFRYRQFFFLNNGISKYFTQNMWMC